MGALPRNYNPKGPRGSRRADSDDDPESRVSVFSAYRESAEGQKAKALYRCGTCNEMLVDELLPDGRLLSLSVCPRCVDCEIVDHVRGLRKRWGTGYI